MYGCRDIDVWKSQKCADSALIMISWLSNVDLDYRTSKHSIPYNFLKHFFKLFLVVSMIYLLIYVCHLSLKTILILDPQIRDESLAFSNHRIVAYVDIRAERVTKERSDRGKLKNRKQDNWKKGKMQDINTCSRYFRNLKLKNQNQNQN